MKWGKIIICFFAAAFCLSVLYFAGRAFVCDSFVVGGESMDPALHRGDRVFVNKLVLGPRIYKDFDFSRPDLRCIRLKGAGRLKVGDIVVFNYPYARSHDTISFKINFVYVKRCVAAPGDTISIVDGYWHNCNCTGIIGDEVKQQALSVSSDSLLSEQGVVLPAFYIDESLGWTIRNFGPLYVPRKGDSIGLTPDNYKRYRRLLQYETGAAPEIIDGEVCIEEKPLRRYVFKHNYYFFGGDNVLNSKDSRYFGPVPEEYIVGVVAGYNGRK